MSVATESKSNDVETRRGMFAMVYDDYGDVSKLHSARMNLPRRLPGQVLIRVHASSVNPIDYRLRQGEMKGLLPGGFPRVPGYDVAGVIADAAHDSPFSVGQRVIAFLDSVRGGAAAEFASCAEDATCALPDEVAFTTGAAIPLAGTTALQSLRDHAMMQPGDRVLINGASGGVGMFAVQIAKAFDCHVDAVASGENAEFCRSLGAQHFYDYEQVDFTESSERWDIVFDAAGKSSYLRARDVLADDGRYVSTEPSVKGMLMTVVTWPLSKSGTVMLAKPKAGDLKKLMELHLQGKLEVTIDSRFDLADLAKAHQRIQDGVDRGKVVVIHPRGE